MQPTPSDVHVNRPLTNISIAYIQSREQFIATKVFPNIPTQKQSDTYFIYPRDAWNRDEMKERAPATESEGSGYDIDLAPPYWARVYAFHKDIPDQVRANQDDPINLDTEATEFISLKALLKREKIFVNTFMKTGVWGKDWTGAASSPSSGQTLQWDQASSTPIPFIRSERRAIVENTGIEPNTLVLGRPTYDALLDHPSIVDRIKYGAQSGGPGFAARANLNVIKELFEIENVLVMNAIENTAKEGQPAVHRFIGGKMAWLGYVEKSPGIMKPSAGYTFSWNGYLAGGPDGERIYKFRMENKRSDRVEIEIAFDMKSVAADLGTFFSGIVA